MWLLSLLFPTVLFKETVSEKLRGLSSRISVDQHPASWIIFHIEFSVAIWAQFGCSFVAFISIYPILITNVGVKECFVILKIWVLPRELPLEAYAECESAELRLGCPRAFTSPPHVLGVKKMLCLADCLNWFMIFFKISFLFLVK